jgi:hypothetical protein
VTALRRLLARRHLALLICAAALLLKLLVPGGYMVTADGGRAGLAVCPGLAPPAAVTAMPAMRHDLPASDHGKPEQPCAFAALAAQMLGATDPMLLGAAIAVIIAAALVRALPSPSARAAFLRPPLRAPPAYR